VYVLAHREEPRVRPVAHIVGRGTSTYSAILVVPEDSEITSLDQVEGRRLTFVTLSSASGYLFPYVYLSDMGIDPERNAVDIPFAGTHKAAFADLVAGRTDAIATFSGLFRLENEEARAQGRDSARIRILEKTGRIPRDLLCVGPSVPDSAIPRIQTALRTLNTHEEEGRRLFRESGLITAWVDAEDADMEPIRDVLERLERKKGKTLEELRAGAR